MLAVKNLERLIEIEADLKAQYETKLDAKAAEVSKAINKQEELQATIGQQKLTIDKQLEQIKELSATKADTKHTEQLNRELNSRSTKLQEEVDAQKKRIKVLQKDLATEREELKTLKQLDAQKLKKNLDANKKKLAEKTAENALLQKSYNKFKKENAELKQKVEELEAKTETAEAKEEATAE